MQRRTFIRMGGAAALMQLLVAVGAMLVAAGVFAEPFRDGDTVVFFGDSITHSGHYHEYVTDFYLTRHPEAKIRFVNSGIGGDTAAGALPRVPVDVTEYDPTWVCFHFGMNDIGRGSYTATPDAAALVRADAAQRNYRANMNRLVAEVRRTSPKARHVYLTPTIYDDTAVPTNIPAGATGWAVVNQVGCNAGLALMAGYVLDAAKRDGALSVNWFTPLQDFLMSYRSDDPHYMITSWDRVHPGALGHSIMAWEFLKAQGVDPVVSDVTVDAASVSAAAVTNAAVSEIAKRDGSLAFTVLAKALPMPVAREAKPVLGRFKVAETLNREIVRVTGLGPGTYALTIDGTEVGRWAAEDLAAGVNLGFNEKTPQYAQAQEVFRRTAELSARARVLRNHHSARWFYQGRAPVDDVKAFVDWFEKYEQDKKGYFQSFVPGYLAYWPHYRETREEFRRDQESVRAAARPVAHRYVLTPLPPPVVEADATRVLGPLPNTSQMLTFWNGVRNPDGGLFAYPERDRADYPITGFVRYCELMACTGGKGLRDPAMRKLFAEQLQPRYAATAKTVRPVRRPMKVSADATLSVLLDFVGNGAAHLTLHRMSQEDLR